MWPSSSSASSAIVQSTWRRSDRLGAQQRMVATRRARASPSRTRAAAPCRTRRRGSASRSSNTRCRRRARPSPNEVIDALSRSRRRAQRRVDDRLEHEEQALAWVAERVERAGLDERLDRPLVEHDRVDALAEVVEVDERTLRLTGRRALRCAPGAVAAAAGRLGSAPTPRKSALAHDPADHVVDGGHLHAVLERIGSS